MYCTIVAIYIDIMANNLGEGAGPGPAAYGTNLEPRLVYGRVYDRQGGYDKLS